MVLVESEVERRESGVWRGVGSKIFNHHGWLVIVRVGLDKEDKSNR
jgi:hypothetical protein